MHQKRFRELQAALLEIQELRNECAAKDALLSEKADTTGEVVQHWTMAPRYLSGPGNADVCAVTIQPVFQEVTIDDDPEINEIHQRRADAAMVREMITFLREHFDESYSSNMRVIDTSRNICHSKDMNVGNYRAQGYIPWDTQPCVHEIALEDVGAKYAVFHTVGYQQGNTLQDSYWFRNNVLGRLGSAGLCFHWPRGGKQLRGAVRHIRGTSDDGWISSEVRVLRVFGATQDDIAAQESDVGSAAAEPEEELSASQLRAKYGKRGRIRRG